MRKPLSGSRKNTSKHVSKRAYSERSKLGCVEGWCHAIQQSCFIAGSGRRRRSRDSCVHEFQRRGRKIHFGGTSGSVVGRACRFNLIGGGRCPGVIFDLAPGSDG